jgi:MoaA/NifB/PqqE/SkfB family radical SAM enzyme
MTRSESQPADGFSKIKYHALQHSVPLTVHLELTYACNWSCGFCYNRVHADSGVLSAEEWRKVLCDLRELGTLIVVLTGGEPLLHPEWLEIARAARERHMAIRVFTNGSLVDEMAADELIALLPLSIELSLHGATAATHDRTSGVKGSFAALWSGIDHLQKRGAPLVLKTPLTRDNEAELDQIVELAASRSLPLRIDSSLKAGDDGSCEPLQWSATCAGVRHLMAHLQAVARVPQVHRLPGGVSCGIGRLTLAIAPDGTVYPCIQWRRTVMGNVRESDVGEIWRSSQLRHELALMAQQVNDRLMAVGGAVSRYPFCLAEPECLEEALQPGSPFLVRAELADRYRDSG